MEDKDKLIIANTHIKELINLLIEEKLLHMQGYCLRVSLLGKGRHCENIKWDCRTCNRNSKAEYASYLFEKYIIAK